MAARLLTGINKSLKIFENILPDMLNGSRRFNKTKLPLKIERTVTVRMLYFNNLKSLSILKYFFLFRKKAILDMMSCNVPRGQILEQYILPNRIVMIRTTMKPVAKSENWLKNFTTEGTK
jgi:hypothetical protein